MPRATQPIAARVSELWRERFPKKSEFMKAAGLNWPMMGKIERGAIPPNHPVVPRLAAVLGVSVEHLNEGSTVPPLTDDRLRMISKQFGSKHKMKTKAVVRAKKPGKALVHVPRERTIQALSKTALRKLNPRALQLARTLATSTNVQIMQGKAYLSLPNMPVDALALLLADYFQAKGVPGVMLLNPDYAEIFG